MRVPIKLRRHNISMQIEVTTLNPNLIEDLLNGGGAQQGQRPR